MLRSCFQRSREILPRRHQNKSNVMHQQSTTRGIDRAKSARLASPARRLTKRRAARLRLVLLTLTMTLIQTR